MSAGYHVSKIFKDLPDNLFDKIISRDIFELSNQLNIKVRELALYLADLPAIFLNTNYLNSIIKSLSMEKQEELAKRVGYHGNALEQLVEHCVANSQELFAFFDIDRQPNSSSHSLSHQKLITPKYTLFPHQNDVVLEVIEKLYSFKRLLLHMPTGSGKTRTTMHIISRIFLSRKNTIIVWLANTRELLEQAASEFEKAWTYLGNRKLDVIRYWGNSAIDLTLLSDGIIIAGLQKLNSLANSNISKLIELSDKTILTVVDEAHIVLAPTYDKVSSILATKNQHGMLLGLSATPGRTWADIEKDRQLSNFFNKNKVTMHIDGYRTPIQYLLAEGYLAKPHFQTLYAPIIFGNKQFEVTKNITDKLGENNARNMLILNKIFELIEKHKRIIVFAPSVKSAKLIYAILKIKRIKSAIVYSEMPQEKRQKNISIYTGNDCDPIVMLNYGVLTTGFDAPQTSAVIIGRPTMSLVLYSQMVGRALRGNKAGGNSEAEIYTVVDPELPGFGDIVDAFNNWEDVW